MNNPIIQIQISSASRDLQCEYNVKKENKILLTASKKNDIGISSVHDEMNLKIYNGEIKKFKNK